jgi:HAD superfamily phosphoserine phosphatase-like hydrolase
MPWYEALARALAPGDHAAFDADGTLWAGDAGEDLQHALVSEGALAAATRDEYERLLRVDMLAAYVHATRALAGLEEAWLRDRARRLVERDVADRVYPEMRGLLTVLAARGVTPWVVSSSNRWVVEAGAATLGIPPERVLAMAVEVEGGVLTGRLVLPAVAREGKAEALRSALPSPPALCAGNSVNDLAMLRLATRQALVVNPRPSPDPATGEDLLAEAEARGWLVHYVG